ncbi:hypothetical protein, partial [Klebsiella pneumoniae]
EDKDNLGKPIIDNGKLKGNLGFNGPVLSSDANYWDMNQDEAYVRWVLGDNNLYLNLDRNLQLALRHKLLSGYMESEIADGFPTLLAG